MNIRRYKPREVQTFDWTPDLAYIVGLITTDGCLSPDGKVVTMTSQDIEIIGHIKTILRRPGKIGYTRNRKLGSEAYRMNVCSVQFYDWLLDIGLMPNKSLRLGELKVPDVHFLDFLRGHLDGDGSITCYLDKYNTFKNEKYVYERIWLKFISASKPHVGWLQRKIIKITGVSGRLHTTKPRYTGRSMYILKFAKKDSLKLLAKIYYSPNLPCLTRKREIYATFLSKLNK